MSETDSAEPAPQRSTTGSGATERNFREWLRDMPRWKKVTVGVAVATVVVAGVLSMTTSGGDATSGGDPSGTGLRTAFVEGTTGGGAGSPQTTAAGEEPASRGFFRLGFSFLAGFSIGTFLRATLKIAAIAFGFWLVMTFALSYIGVVKVDWHAMDDLWKTFASNIESEVDNFQSFMLGSLPATGLAVAGFAIGLRRH